ncbi:hypothetical protein AAMO2058_001612700 [Amorphochlora amoebiformis]
MCNGARLGWAVFALVGCIYVGGVRVGSKSGVQSNLTASMRKDDKWSKCKTCVFMMERIKKGTNMILPTICTELRLKYPDSYTDCHGLLKEINLEANNIRYWMFEGCYKYEIYEAREWTQPCPSHVICSSVGKYCPELPPENPFPAAMESKGESENKEGAQKK